MQVSAAPFNTLPLGDLLEGLACMADREDASIQVSGVQIDSRLVSTGDIFLACEGHVSDGRKYIGEAIEAGAVAVVSDSLTEQARHVFARGDSANIPLVEVDCLADICSEIGGRFYGSPSKKIPVFAVTGTNGKTSCTQLIMQYLVLLGKHCAVSGTLGVGVDGNFEETGNTTPNAIDLQRYLAQWLSEGVDAVAMEVSSHGLVQGRVAALQFDSAIFTNLTHEHLDYHGSMHAYAKAKAALFRHPGLKTAVINSEDDYSGTLEDSLSDSVRLIRYNAQDSEHGLNADVWVEAQHYDANGVTGLLHSPWGDYDFSSPLLGRFNLSNLLAVISTLGVQGYPLSKLVSATPSLRTVDGRMEILSESKLSDLVVVIDYAHTPDALEKALHAMRLHCGGKLWCIFGCGGDRDQSKRPKMGQIVERYADHVIVTSDNPRHESPEQIIDEILGGVERPTLVEVDRAKAIEFALLNAGAGDSILIAGKGHEPYQLFGDTKVPFKDAECARLGLEKRLAEQSTEEGK
jgi:UDP-N-acetylmuramoyl-L-alanyl-D-glutamate--2,6-diaminopimelate ligase